MTSTTSFSSRRHYYIILVPISSVACGMYWVEKVVLDVCTALHRRLHFFSHRHICLTGTGLVSCSLEVQRDGVDRLLR